MDSETTFETAKKKVAKFCDDRGWDEFHNPKDLAIGIITEASEFLEIFRFKQENEIMDMMTNSYYRKKMGEELGDVLYFLLRFSDRYNFDLSDELEKKLKLNDERYPIQLAKGSNKKYNEFKNNLKS
ncbi:MAG: nucleotide pyrophosphohydrolase [Methanomassiliicoccales archaeon]